MLSSLPGIVGNLIAAAVCFLAMWLGGKTERAVGALLLVCQFASVVIQSRADWSGVPWVLIIDVLLLAPAFGLVLYGDRPWTVGFAAYQSLTVLTHAAMVFEPAGDRPDVRTWIYITGLVLWGYLIWVCLLWGTFSAWRRRGSPGLHQIRRVTGTQRRGQAES